MRTYDYQRTIAATSSGSTVHHTSPDRICAVEIDLPDVSTQRKIAKVLDGIEEKIRNNIDINDKNSYSSLLFFIEILCYLKSKNMSLNDYINKIYKEVGYYYDLSENIKYDGLNSINKMNKIMDDLRNDKIIFPLYKEKIDFLNRKELKTNAIKYIFNDQTSLIIRPSGTEPKIKLYFTSFDKEPTKSLEKMESLKKRVLFALNK